MKRLKDPEPVMDIEDLVMIGSRQKWVWSTYIIVQRAFMINLIVGMEQNVSLLFGP